MSGGAGKKYRDLASELDAWDRLCGEEEAAMQTGPGLTEVERKSRRKSHTPGGRNDVTRVSHIEINGAVAPCALGAQALFEIETWTGRAGGTGRRRDKWARQQLAAKSGTGGGGGLGWGGRKRRRGRRRRVVVGVLDYQVRDLGLFVT